MQTRLAPRPAPAVYGYTSPSLVALARQRVRPRTARARARRCGRAPTTTRGRADHRERAQQRRPQVERPRQPRLAPPASRLQLEPGRAVEVAGRRAVTSRLSAHRLVDADAQRSWYGSGAWITTCATAPSPSRRHRRRRRRVNSRSHGHHRGIGRSARASPTARSGVTAKSTPGRSGTAAARAASRRVARQRSASCSPGGTPARRGGSCARTAEVETSVARPHRGRAREVDAHEQRRDAGEVLRVPDAGLRDEHDEQHGEARAGRSRGARSRRSSHSVTSTSARKT